MDKERAADVLYDGTNAHHTEHINDYPAINGKPSLMDAILDCMVQYAKDQVNLGEVSRVEVIDEKGRTYVNWNPKNKVQISMQDNNRTMKIFITKNK